MKPKTHHEISIVKLMWLFGAAAAVLEFAYLAFAGYMYEACVQAFIVFMVGYLWPRDEK